MKTLYPILLIIFMMFLPAMPGCDNNEKETLAPREQRQEQIAPQYAGTIIALGNSLTAGLGVAEEDSWPALLEKKLREEGYNWQVINAGISGETSSGALRRIQWILSRDPNIVILETGANDGLRGIPVPVIRQNIREAVEMIRDKNVTVLLAGMQMVQNLGPEYTEAFSSVYPSIAGETGVLLIPFLLKDVAGRPDLNQADTIHPNEKGHAIIARTVYPYVIEAIETGSP